MEPVSRDGVQLTRSADVVGGRRSTRACSGRHLEDGRFPAADGRGAGRRQPRQEQRRARSATSLRVGRGDAAVDVEVVGTGRQPGRLGNAALYVPWDDAAALRGHPLGRRGRLGRPGRRWRGRLAPDATVEPADEWVAARQAEISRGVDVIAIMALLFVAIALFVGRAGHRQHLLDPLRPADARLRAAALRRRHPPPAASRDPARGARPRRWSASAVGRGRRRAPAARAGGPRPALVRRHGPGRARPRLGRVPRSPSASLVTLGAAWLPTRSATRVAPLAALRPDTGVDVRSAAGRWRLGAGRALPRRRRGPARPGGRRRARCPRCSPAAWSSFVGVLLRRAGAGAAADPARRPACPAAVRCAGSPPATPCATRGVRRPPRPRCSSASPSPPRSSPGLASSRTAIDRDMDDSYPLDATLTAADAPLDAALVDRVRGTAGVADAAGPGRHRRRTIGGLEVPLLGLGRGRRRRPRCRPTSRPPDGTVLLPYDGRRGAAHAAG